MGPLHRLPDHGRPLHRLERRDNAVAVLWRHHHLADAATGSHQPDQSDGAGQVVCATPWASTGLRQPGSAVRAGRGPVANADDHQRRGLAMGSIIAGHPRLESYAHPGAVVDEASAGRHGPAPRRGPTRWAGGRRSTDTSWRSAGAGSPLYAQGGLANAHPLHPPGGPMPYQLREHRRQL